MPKWITFGVLAVVAAAYAYLSLHYEYELQDQEIWRGSLILAIGGALGWMLSAAVRRKRD